ncbi:phosphoglycerate mutase [Actinomycetes bacterium]|nr:phosphoglycerate mutase [Actinomycetes bacterium]
MQIVLIRHAHSQANARGVLSGRLPNISLSEKGIKQSQELASRLGSFPIAQIRISPMQRCHETIAPWLGALPKTTQKLLVKDENLTEVDYGSWSGKKLSVLSRNKLWKTVQGNPSAMYFPEGEGLAHMQQRAMTAVHDSLNVKRSGVAVLVSHGDVIKAIVASALGMHLDDFQRIVIDPASVTILDYSNGKARLTLMNDSRSVLHDVLAGPKRSKNLLGGGAGK